MFVRYKRQQLLCVARLSAECDVIGFIRVLDVLRRLFVRSFGHSPAFLGLNFGASVNS